MNDVETTLTEALHDRAARVRVDEAASLAALRSTLSDAPTSATRRHRAGWWHSGAAMIASAAAVLAALSAYPVAHALVHHDHVAAAAGRPSRLVPPFHGPSPTIGHGPYPSSDYALVTSPAPSATAPSGTGGFVYDVLRLSDGRVMGTLPDPGVNEQWAAVLAADGTRVYGTWSEDWDARLGQPDGASRVGYLDLHTGRFVTVERRATGDVDAVTVSADGSTLAYQWSRTPPVNDVWRNESIVVRSLATGRDRYINHVPQGPIEDLEALSPDGSELALAPTGHPAPLLVVNLRDTDPLSTAVSVPNGCPAATPQPDNEPQWVAGGLYAYRACNGARSTPSNVVRITDGGRRSVALRGVTVATGNDTQPTGYLVAGTATAPRFVVQDGDGTIRVVGSAGHGKIISRKSLALVAEIAG